MNNETIFADGFNIYAPNEKTQHFLFGKASINVNKFIAFLNEHKNEKGYVNLNFPISKKTGEPYAVLDTYKPAKPQEPTQAEAMAMYRDQGTPLDDETLNPEDIPF